MIDDYRKLFKLHYQNLHLEFARRKANIIAHKLEMVAISNISYHILSFVPSYIDIIILNEMR